MTEQSYDLELALIRALCPGEWEEHGGSAGWFLPFKTESEMYWPAARLVIWTPYTHKDGTVFRPDWHYRAQNEEPALWPQPSPETYVIQRAFNITYRKLLRTLRDGGFRKTFGFPPLSELGL